MSVPGSHWNGDGDVSVGAAHRPLRDVVCDEIRRRIIDGSFVGGERLTEERLAEALGVSRNPVREALRVLESQGFVQMLPRRGAFVAELSPEEVDEMYEVRAALESLATRLAARNATDEEVEALSEVLCRAEEAVRTGDVARMTELNTEFHELIISAARNRQLRDIVLPLRGRVQMIFSKSANTRGVWSLAEHAEIRDAIRDRDEDRAADLADRHIREARRSGKSSSTADR